MGTGTGYSSDGRFFRGRSLARRLRPTYRANNDLLYYHLDVRVDPDKQILSGKNSIRFKMLKDGSRIQLDLCSRISNRQDPIGSTFEGCAAVAALSVRRGEPFYVDFPKKLRKGRIYTPSSSSLD